MPVGAFNRLDQELVRKYSKLKMDNPDTTKLVDPQKILSAMNDYASVQRGMMEMNARLKDICSGVTTKSVSYMRINFNPPRPRKS